MRHIVYILIFVLSFSIDGFGQIDTVSIKSRFIKYVNAGYQGNIPEVINLTYSKFVEKVGKDSLTVLLKKQHKLVKSENTTNFYKIISVNTPITYKAEFIVPINFESIGYGLNSKMIQNQWAFAITDTNLIDWKFIIINRPLKDLLSDFVGLPLPQNTVPSLLDNYRINYKVDKIRIEWNINQKTEDSCINAKHYIYSKDFFKDDYFDCTEDISFSQTLDKDENLLEYFIIDKDSKCYFYEYQYIGKDGYADSSCIYSSCKNVIAVKYMHKEYYKNGLLKKYIDNKGNELLISYSYDKFGRVTLKEVKGYKTKETHSYLNGIIQNKTKTYLNGNRPDDIWTYNERGYLISYQQGKYRKTVYVYDSNFNIISKSEQGLRKDIWVTENEETFKYNSFNDLIEARQTSGDRLRHLYRYEYIEGLKINAHCGSYTHLKGFYYICLND